MKRALWPLAALLLVMPAGAQQSESYKLETHAINAGGHPEGGTVLTSPGYYVSLDALGEAFTGDTVASDSYLLSGGLVAAYTPPGEVLALLFSDESTLIWNAASSAGDYNLYRDLLGVLSELGYGQCEQEELIATSAVDTDEPSEGAGYFYLITAENRLEEEGSKGRSSAGTERLGTECP